MQKENICVGWSEAASLEIHPSVNLGWNRALLQKSSFENNALKSFKTNKNIHNVTDRFIRLLFQLRHLISTKTFINIF